MKWFFSKIFFVSTKVCIWPSKETPTYTPVDKTRHESHKVWIETKKLKYACNLRLHFENGPISKRKHINEFGFLCCTQNWWHYIWGPFWWCMLLQYGCGGSWKSKIACKRNLRLRGIAHILRSKLLNIAAKSRCNFYVQESIFNYINKQLTTDTPSIPQEVVMWSHGRWLSDSLLEDWRCQHI